MKNSKKKINSKRTKRIQASNIRKPNTNFHTKPCKTHEEKTKNKNNPIEKYQKKLTTQSKNKKNDVKIFRYLKIKNVSGEHVVEQMPIRLRLVQN